MIGCCHGNSVQYTHMNEKETPGVLQSSLQISGA